MPAAAAPQRKRDAARRARRLRLMIFDVDGVMTDGRLWYGPEGELLKAFHVLDGLGIKLLAETGLATAILTARSSRALERRSAELGIGYLVMGANDKRAGFEDLLRRTRLDPAAAGYVGDDLGDLPVLRRCGLACAPASAHPLVRRAAQYVTRAAGGAGAVREVCEFVMRAQGTLDAAFAPFLE
jgi:3-deoxy-D-manno-octulosonate 8-phosphate phosphatase (KDO 8-P phosphatase)